MNKSYLVNGSNKFKKFFVHFSAILFAFKRALLNFSEMFCYKFCFHYSVMGIDKS